MLTHKSAAVVGKSSSPCFILSVRHTGLEPVSSRWQRDIIHTHIRMPLLAVSVRGIEPRFAPYERAVVTTGPYRLISSFASLADLSAISRRTCNNMVCLCRRTFSGIFPERPLRPPLYHIVACRCKGKFQFLSPSSTPYRIRTDDFHLERVAT